MRLKEYWVEVPPVPLNMVVPQNMAPLQDVEVLCARMYTVSCA